MKDLKEKLKTYSEKHWPLVIITIFACVFFWKFFVKGLFPIPADFIVGVYFPWLDYKWVGYLAGVPVKNPLLADIPSLIYPVRAYAMELIKAGVFPLWNSLQFGGYPLMATFQSAVFYPLNFLYFLFEIPTAWSLQVIFQPILIGTFTYLFLRNLGLSKIGSLLGSVAYSYSGFNLIWLEYNVHGHVAALIPLILFLTDKLLREKRMYWGVLLSLSVGAQVFAGYPQLTFYTALITLFWVILRTKGNLFSWKKLQSIFVVGSFGLLGLLLSSVQFIPGWELLSNSQRITEGVSGGFEVAFLPWKQLITIFIPDFFGNPATYNYWGPGNYTNTVAYTGLATFILATFASINLLKNKVVRFFVISALFSIFVALPTPLSLAFYQGGFLGVGAATATRILVLFNLSISVLAAFGADLFISNKPKFRDLRAFYIPLLVIFGFTGALAWVWWQAQTDSVYFETLLEYKNIEIWSANYRIALRNSAIPILVFGLSLAVFIISIIFKKLDRLHLAIFLFILITAELFRFGWKFTPFSEKEFLYPETPVLEFLQSQERPFRVSEGDVIPISMWIPYGLSSFSGYDAVYPGRVASFISAVNSNNPEAAPMGRYGSVDGYTTEIFNLTNTKYVLALKRDEISSPDETGEISYKFQIDKFKGIYEDKSVVVLENLEVIPRAFFVSNWDVVNEEEALNLLMQEDFPLGERIVLEKDPHIEKAPASEAEVDFITYSSQEIVLSTKSNSAGLLFLGDTWYPGWRVFVDGIENEIFIADYVFRAVVLEEGQHEVRFIYYPKSFKIGAWLSSATLIFLTGLVLHETRRKNSGRASRKSSS